MQQMLEELRLPEAACRLRMRIGVHAGEPLPEDGRLFGTCINTAVRVCSAAPPSRVVVSDVVCLLASGRSFKFAPLGLIALKGFDSPMPLSEFLWRD
jgi:class 3 adenylate cyclase